MLEWGLVILVAGILVIIERQVTIGRNQMTILKEVRELRLALAKASKEEKGLIVELLDVLSPPPKQLPPGDGKHHDAFFGTSP